MYINTLSKQDLEYASLTMGQKVRIAKTKKRFAILNSDKLHLVNDLNRTLRDKLKDAYSCVVEVYDLHH